MPLQKKQTVLSTLLIFCILLSVSSAASISPVQSVNNTSEESVTTASEDDSKTSQATNDVPTSHSNITDDLVISEMHNFWNSGYGDANVSRTEVDCPVSNNHCICTGEIFHRVCCKNINDLNILQETIANLTERTFVLEVGGLNISAFPLQALNSPYLISLVISNSTFKTIFNNTSLADGNNASILHHLSLENITTSEWSWSQFNFFRRLDVFFVYNTTIGESITPSLGNHMSKSLKFLSIAETNVSTIESDSFKNLKNMTYLRISHSKLATLTRDILPSPSKLEALRLDHNLISSLPNDMFTNMGNLSVVTLSNNRISILSEEVFSPIWKSNMHLELRNNPIKCDCRILWLVTSPTKPKIVGECAHPKRLFGREIESLTEEDLHC